MSQTTMSKQHGVSDAFLDGLEALALQPDGSWWRDVLLRDDVFIAVRRNSLNVYFRGVSIFRIDDLGNGKISPKTHVKYLVRQQQALAELADGSFVLPPDGVIWPRYDGPATLADMLSAARSLSGAEKSGLHPLILGNSRVIDVEVSLDRAKDAAVDDGPDDGTTDAAAVKFAKDQDRLDVVTLEKRVDGLWVVFHEAKHFSNAAIRAKAGKSPPVIGQMQRYRKTLTHHAQVLAERYAAVCQALVRIQSMRDKVRGANASMPIAGTIDSLVHAAAITTAPLRIDTDPRLIVFGFDADQKGGLLRTYLDVLRQAEPTMPIYAVGDPASAKGAFRPLTG